MPTAAVSAVAGVPSSRIAKRSGNRRVYKHWRKTEPLLRGIATPSDVSTSAKVQLDGKYGGTKRDRNLVARVTTKERQITSLQRDVAQYEAKIATLSAHHAVNWYDGLCLQPTGGDAIEHPSPRPGLPTAYSAEQVVRLRNQTLCVLLMLGKIVDEAKLDIAFNEAYLTAVRNAPTSSPTTREASTTRQEMAAAIVHDLSLTDKPSTILAWLREYLELGGFKRDGRGKRKRDN
ncbi:hypothetical protein SDRG_05623 [Saprolegnia diclina VS20]|uniref:Uncharacterized protein n=1 Tax=Saprolegnia diclina (strain VS20) TaxID=1156394 RepID=T0QS09_SAPDV|nr:hypothetical protein SDRG_05623 [Saprolegnia diclina VS20]EQC36790.1 hypothetical protein SDRG_05623 [Saprolegnia diclina VS20]|eukprot:XP_008609571.1 hypothetical protein SDRG_05623 [Saprolegnia diclina VS20]